MKTFRDYLEYGSEQGNSDGTPEENRRGFEVEKYDELTDLSEKCAKKAISDCMQFFKNWTLRTMDPKYVEKFRKFFKKELKAKLIENLGKEK